MKVVLDEDSHTYKGDSGVIVPSVTQILSSVGITRTFHAMRKYRARGHNVHRAIELMHEGRLDEDGERERDRRREYPIMPYVDQWRRCAVRYEIVPLKWETVVTSEGHFYAGRLDLMARISGKEGICDLKTMVKLVKPGAATRLQCAAYAMSDELRHTGVMANPRYAICLTPDEFDVVPYKGEGDFIDWASVVRTYHFMARHKLLWKPRRT